MAPNALQSVSKTKSVWCHFRIAGYIPIDGHDKVTQYTSSLGHRANDLLLTVALTLNVTRSQTLPTSSIHGIDGCSALQQNLDCVHVAPSSGAHQWSLAPGVAPLRTKRVWGDHPLANGIIHINAPRDGICGKMCDGNM